MFAVCVCVYVCARASVDVFDVCMSAYVHCVFVYMCVCVCVCVYGNVYMSAMCVYFVGVC